VRLKAAKSSLGRHRNLRLARPQGSDSTSLQKTVSASPDPRARTRPRLRRRSPPRPTPRLGLDLAPEDSLRLARPQGSDLTSPRTTISASPDPRARTQPQLRKTISASLDPRARAQPRLGRRSPPRPTPRLGLNLDLGRRSPPRPTPGPRLSLDLGGATASPDLGLGLTMPQGGPSLPYLAQATGNKSRCPIWLALVKQVMMAPRVLHDDGGSQPPTEARRRQQGSDSPDSYASTGLKRSSDGHDAT
jgi:hypothetical protein